MLDSEKRPWGFKAAARVQIPCSPRSTAYSPPARPCGGDHEGPARGHDEPPGPPRCTLAVVADTCQLTSSRILRPLVARGEPLLAPEGWPHAEARPSWRSHGETISRVEH